MDILFLKNLACSGGKTFLRAGDGHLSTSAVRHESLPFDSKSCEQEWEGRNRKNHQSSSTYSLFNIFKEEDDEEHGATPSIVWEKMRDSLLFSYFLADRKVHVRGILARNNGTFEEETEVKKNDDKHDLSA
ncbi:hypothetical protein OIU76_021975 [Salix suchowensis]|nr:hypothetical protein OIU76_021975 [Salix suchowensis]